MQKRTHLSTYIAVFLVCLLADLVFLRHVLFDDDVRAPASDIARAMPYARELGKKQPQSNPYLSDWSYSIHSWQRLVRESYMQGHLPLWNDRAGCGQPLIGNLQAEVFSPYQPLNVIAGDQYIDWKQLAQLLVAQVSFLILIWTLSLSPWAALVGALAFSFGSYIQGWAVHPVAGSAAFAPAILAAFLALRHQFRGTIVFGGGIAIALSICSGHIESTFMACLMSSFLAFLLSDEKPQKGSQLRRALFVPQAVLLGFVGLALSACQVLPFLDYLDQSLVTTIRGMAPKRVIPSLQLFTLLDPKAFGFPGANESFFGDGNYMESTIHLGRVVLLLSLYGLMRGLGRQRKLIIPLVVTITCGLFLAFAPPHFHERMTFFPLNVMPLLRMHFWASVLLPLLAAFGMDFILNDLKTNRRKTVTSSFWASFIVMLGYVGMINFVPHYEFDFLWPTLMIAFPLSIWLCHRAQKGSYVPCAVLLVAAILLESQTLWGPFVPVASASALSPPSPSLSFVEKQPGRLRLLPSVWDLPPELGNLHDLTSLRTYDGMGLMRLSALMLHQRAFLGPPVHAPIFRVNPGTLDMLSVGWTMSNFPPEEMPFPFMEEFGVPGATQEFPYVCRPGQQLELIVSQPEGLPLEPGAIKLTIHGPNSPDLTWSLGDAQKENEHGIVHQEMDSPIASYRKKLRGFQDSPHFYFAFLPAPSTIGRTVTGTLTISQSSPRLLIRVITRDGLNAQTVSNQKNIFIGRRRSALPRAYLAAATTFCGLAEATETLKSVDQRHIAQAIIQTSRPGFNPHETTILESKARDDFSISPGKRNPRAMPLRKLASGQFEIEVDSEENSVLVFSECFARGWTAYIDGVPTDILAANVCSMAVALPPGEHKVEFYFWPSSLTWGFCISLGMFSIMIIVVIRSARRQRIPQLVRSESNMSGNPKHP